MGGRPAKPRARIRSRARIVWVAVLICAASLPLVVRPQRLDLGVQALIYVTLALGLNITVGFAGLLDLGYVAFYAVGAYTYGILNYHYKLPFVIALPLGGIMAALAGFLLGSPTLRLRGDYLAIVTLGFAEMTRLVANNWMSVTNGPNGLNGIERPSLFGYFAVKPRGVYLRAGDAAAMWAVDEKVPLYYIALGLTVLAVFASLRLNDSRFGRALVAIREDETAAQGMGINTSLMKILAFTLAASFAGLAGVLFAAKQHFINPESFTFMESVIIVSMVVLGGMGSVPGVVLGAVILHLVPELLRDVLTSEQQSYRMLLFGMLMIVMMLWRPQGLLPSARMRGELAGADGEQ